MSDLKQSILKLSNEGSPIVIFSNSSGVSLQQMPDKKWSKLTEPHKNKIRKYVANRNEKLLDTVNAENLTEIESHVLKYTGKATQSETPQSKSDREAGQRQAIHSRSDLQIEKEEQTFTEDSPLSPEEKEEDREAGHSVPLRGPKAGQRQRQEKEEETTDDEEEYKKYKFDEENETIDRNSDLDLTPNFVNTFFGYIDSLLVKKKDVEQVNSPDPSSDHSQPTQATDKTPDYSDPNAEVFSSNAALSSTQSPLPEGWTEHVSTTSDPGKKYYYNEKTGETEWERPVDESVSGETKDKLENKSEDKSENKLENKSENQPNAGSESDVKEEGELAEGWTEHVSASSDPGKKYYYNEKTGETVWEKPVKAKTETTTSENDWTEHVSTTSNPGKTYYFNEKTGETVWEKPPGFGVAPVEQNSEESSKNKVSAKDKQVVQGKCFNCGSAENLTLKTYKLESDRAVQVSFCCFKCFEAVEF